MHTTILLVILIEVIITDAIDGPNMKKYVRIRKDTKVTVDSTPNFLFDMLEDAQNNKIFYIEIDDRNTEYCERNKALEIKLCKSTSYIWFVKEDWVESVPLNEIVAARLRGEIE